MMQAVRYYDRNLRCWIEEQESGVLLPIEGPLPPEPPEPSAPVRAKPKGTPVRRAPSNKRDPRVPIGIPGRLARKLRALARVTDQPQSLILERAVEGLLERLLSEDPELGERVLEALRKDEHERRGALIDRARS
jgi:predicted transcriptional regulator